MNTEHRTTEGEIKEIWERLTAGESSIKSAHHRIDSLQELSKSIKDLAVSTAQIATETKALREDYEKADKRIETLEEKPTKRYETFVTAILTGLGTGIVGYLLALVLH
jgi:chromosome segregation ATPase